MRAKRQGLNHLDKQYGPLWSVAAAWVGINNDGQLDIFVTNDKLFNFFYYRIKVLSRKAQAGSAKQETLLRD